MNFLDITEFSVNVQSHSKNKYQDLMSQLDFNRKISTQRKYSRNNDKSYIQTAVESDRGRVINSAAIRRLQQKTQVFPLERNAAVRSRLTHSLEVQQVGRYIVQQIAWRLRKNASLCPSFLELERAIESLVEMACLMHDIGNPPFGHFGEKAISDWFETFLKQDTVLTEQADQAPLRTMMLTDLTTFEGNAQAIRLVFSLLKLNLTYAQAASILKYTRPAQMPKSEVPPDFKYLMKKPGFYLSEAQDIEALQAALQMQPGCRHPLSYIMEAADDISYCYADIEDAVEKQILTVERLIELLKEAYKNLGGDIDGSDFNGKSFNDILRDAKKYYDRETIDKANQFFVRLRVSLNHILTNHAVDRFVDNIEAVYHGSFNGALLEDESPAHKLAETFKMVALAEVFCHKEVQLQELRGYRIIQGLLEYYKPLIQMPHEDFQGLLSKRVSVIKDYPLESRMAAKLPGKHCKAYQDGLQQYDVQSPQYALWEFYYRCRLMQDFVSGMTDQHALEQFQSLMVYD